MPHPSFFHFCDELLEMYRHNERIMQISGNAFHLGKLQSRYSYSFSNFHPTWGWATWRRAWQHYDVTASIWPKVRNTSWVRDIVKDARVARHLEDMFNLTFKGKIDTWDYQWLLSSWAQKGLSIIPKENLVSNIGFGNDSTHTFSSEGDKRAYLPLRAMSFPLRHPPAGSLVPETDRHIIEEVILPALLSNVSSCNWFAEKWSEVCRERPSLQSPRTFLKRLLHLVLPGACGGISISMEEGFMESIQQVVGVLSCVLSCA